MVAFLRRKLNNGHFLLWLIFFNGVHSQFAHTTQVTPTLNLNLNLYFH